MINTKVEFEAWPKIYRKGKGTYTVMEKIDGTNAQIVITEDGDFSRENFTHPASGAGIVFFGELHDIDAVGS